MLLVFIILVIVTVCVTIVCTYFLLNAEDYRWYAMCVCMDKWSFAFLSAEESRLQISKHTILCGYGLPV